MTKEKNPLAGWIERQLWFSVGVEKGLTCNQTVRISFWHPPGLPDKQITKLTDKHAARFVTILKQLLPKEQTNMIVQGSDGYRVVE